MISHLRSVLALALILSSIPWQPVSAGTRAPGVAPERTLAYNIPPSDQFGIMGINTSWAEAINGADIRSNRATSAGATWDRWPVPWDSVEPGCDGQFNWVIQNSNQNLNFDVGIPQAHGHQLKAVAVLRGVPACYRYNQEGVTATGFIEGLEQPPYQNGEINSLNRWGYYVHQVVSRYGQYIDAYEILNEPENLAEWPPNVPEVPEQSPYVNVQTQEGRQLYLRMLQVAAEVIRKEDTYGDQTIILTAPFMPVAVDANRPEKGSWYRDLLRDIVQEERQNDFDVFALHEYGRPWNTYASIEAIRRFGTLNTKPIWVTEAGVVSAEKYPVYKSDHIKCDIGFPCADDYEMASYVIQQYVFAFGNYQNVGKVFHHQLQDDHAFEWGLFDDENKDRPILGPFVKTTDRPN
jgi:hypothetical protein